MEAKPVLKWAGGKRQLLPEILRRLPTQIDTYYEPFIGGGAVFFALAAEGRFRHAVIGDVNPDLVNVYREIQYNHVAVTVALQNMARQHSEEFFYSVRGAGPEMLDSVGMAARTLYLNRTCFNGLYRVNRKGQFNVPFGRYKNPTICDAENIAAVSRALQDVTIWCGDFTYCCADAKSGDAVYLDPPYLPVSKTSSFASYAADKFGVAEHERLAQTMGQLRDRGAFVLLSNSDTDQTRAVFGSFAIESVQARRAINSKGAKRGPVGEILVGISEAAE